MSAPYRPPTRWDRLKQRVSSFLIQYRIEIVLIIYILWALRYRALLMEMVHP